MPCQLFIDNHLHQGNALGIDQRRIIWKRVVDLNDRALRHVTVGLGSPVNGIPREDGFDITVASEIMAILCLATDIERFEKSAWLTLSSVIAMTAHQSMFVTLRSKGPWLWS